VSRWFRHYAGMMRDAKLVAVAIRSKQPVERVVWVWGAILESAAEIDDGGAFLLDAAEVAYFLRADEADICSVVDALAAAGRVSDGRVVKWGDRQYQSDKSTERQARYRERRRSTKAGSDEDLQSGDVTPPSPNGRVTPQETDTETETETEIKPPAPSSEPSGARDIFDEVWKAFPANPSSSETKAMAAFSATKAADRTMILAAAQRFGKWFAEDCAARKRTLQAGLRFAPHLSTWIESGAWRGAGKLPISDEPGPIVPMVRLNRERDHALWSACERVSGKRAATDGLEWSFKAEIVAKAKQELGVSA